MKRPTPPGKTRTREHVIADLAVNHLERRLLLCGYTFERIHADYGYDGLMWTFSAAGEIESGFVCFQIKATENLPLLTDNSTISWPVSRRDLRLWLKEAYPVILVVYDRKSERAYWLYTQAYFASQSTTDLFSAGDTLNVHIPTRNRLNVAAIREIAKHKREIGRQLSGTVHHHV